MFALKGNRKSSTIPKKTHWLLRRRPIRILIPVLIIFVFLFASPAFAQGPYDTLTYVVKTGDSLSKIGLEFGDFTTWLAIHQANRDKIQDPDKIYPGQTLVIPTSAILSELTFQVPEQGRDKDAVKVDSQEGEPDRSDTLKKFRDAFEGLVKNSSNTSSENTEPEKKAVQQGLDFGGLVVNRTTSKMGRDFFNAFYDQWEAPEEAGNFFLEISEQPMPSMGAMVLIKIDNQIVYKARLQPRNDFMDQLVNKSVAMCYRYLYQQLSSTQPMIY